MELKQLRKFKGSEYTISDFYVDGVKLCNICEDPVRVLVDKNKDGDFDDPGEGKVYANTAIPAGKYEVIITYSNRFKKHLPLLLNVPGYSGIRIHPGNYANSRTFFKKIKIDENKVLFNMNSEDNLTVL